jgi:predicted RNA binding protein YcfA (HicA-like mRNA interferase family)
LLSESGVTQVEKRIQRIGRNPRNVSSEELVAILTALGFDCRGGKGSHRCYRHPNLPGVLLTVPMQTPLRRVYVLQSLNAIHRLREVMDDDE